MATRRARIKVAPNLGLSRNKAKPQPVKPKIVMTSDTDEQSEAETCTVNEDQETAVQIDENKSVENCQKPNYQEDGVTFSGYHDKNGIETSNGYSALEITPMQLDNSHHNSNSKEIISGYGNSDRQITADKLQPLSEGNKTQTGGKVRLPVMRNKFRPNLNLERGQRMVTSRVRTASSSSTNSESDCSLRQQPPDSPILRSAILTPKPARVRRTTESRSTFGDRNQFHNRKQVHKAKFSKGVPERTNLTMFDLIYYNPQDGKRMSLEEGEEDIEKVDDPDDGAHQLPEKEEKTEPVAKKEEQSDTLPVPRVKVGINGEIILDEESLHVETTQQKEAKVILKDAPLVFENNKTSIGYGRWNKKRRHKDWSEKETLKFFKALSVVGSDFSMMESIFTNRSRNELRLKFKKEEKINLKMVNKCLQQKRMFADLDTLFNESEDEVEEVEDVDPGRKSRSKKGRKKRPRRRYRNRGLYDSSSGGEEGDIETSKSPVRKRLKNGNGDSTSPLVQRVKRPLVLNGDQDSGQEEAEAEVEEVIEEPPTELPDLSGIEFPPGLLAANPSLAGAKPGSLVVVAQQTRRPLHLYMVNVTEKKPVADMSPSVDRSVSFNDTMTELRLDPAVFRAIDRGKLHRQRTMSECDEERKRERGQGGGQGKTGRTRQRTHSESSSLAPFTGQSYRKRFLSGNQGKGGDGAKNYTGGARKRKGGDAGKKSKTKKRQEDEEIDSEGSDIEGKGDAGYESEEDHETAEEKRLRLAKVYLAEIEEELAERKGDEVDLSKDISERLKEDVEEEQGKLRREFAGQLCSLSPADITYYGDKQHKLSLTCVVVSPDSRRVYTASKDAGLLVWDLHTGHKLNKVPGGRSGQQSYHMGHCSSVLALAVSSDGKLLASGDRDKLIMIWDTDSLARLHTFKGHRDAVSGLVFRRGTHTLYSASYDRSVKIWSVDERAYVETLFGHQDSICGIDCGTRERCITVGGRDATARLWKIVEESQLVFNGPQSSLDCVKLLNEEHWVTAGEDGHLAVWGVQKKKPLALVQQSHGKDPSNEDPHWVSAVATLTNTDTVITGSRDGWLRVWQVGEGFRSLQEVHKLQLSGFINSLDISPCGGWIVAGLGQEHRLGRWWSDKTARNKLAVIRVNSQAVNPPQIR